MVNDNVFSIVEYVVFMRWSVAMEIDSGQSVIVRKDFVLNIGDSVAYDDRC